MFLAKEFFFSKIECTKTLISTLTFKDLLLHYGLSLMACWIEAKVLFVSINPSVIIICRVGGCWCVSVALGKGKLICIQGDEFPKGNYKTP